jgi:hypothetical protein
MLIELLNILSVAFRVNFLSFSRSAWIYLLDFVKNEGVEASRVMDLCIIAESNFLENKGKFKFSMDFL